MKKILAISTIVAMAAAVAYAGNVGGRRIVTLGTATGAGTLSITDPYQAIQLKRISVQGSLNATNVVTTSRIIKDAAGTAYTNTVGAVTCEGGAGTQATLAHTLLLPGDSLAFSSLVSTGSVVIVEYEVQQH